MKQEKENVESKQDFKEVFRKLVRRVIEKSRCEKVLAAISDLRRDREAFEKLCFQFIEDEESALYRYTSFIKITLNLLSVGFSFMIECAFSGSIIAGLLGI